MYFYGTTIYVSKGVRNQRRRGDFGELDRCSSQNLPSRDWGSSSPKSFHQVPRRTRYPSTSTRVDTNKTSQTKSLYFRRGLHTVVKGLFELQLENQRKMVEY